MAVSLDTYDEETGVHPRNKVIPSKRLATAGLNIAYGLKEFPSNGPFPTNFDIFLRPSYGIQVDIAYDQPFIWNATESEGFYLCMEPSFADCMLKKNIGLWQKVVLPNSHDFCTRTRTRTVSLFCECFKAYPYPH